MYHLTTDNLELNKLVIFQTEYSSCSNGNLQIVQTQLIQKYTATLHTSSFGLFSGCPQNPLLLLGKMELNVELLLACRIFFWVLSTHSLMRSWHLSSKISPLLAPNLCCTTSYMRNILFPRTVRTFLIFLGKISAKNPLPF